MVEGVSEPEREAIEHVASLLNALSRYADSFTYVVAFIGFIDGVESDLKSPWTFMACRDAGMSIWHFGEVIDAIRKSLGACPTLRPKINFPKLRAAEKSFHTRFPNAEQMRHSIAHSAHLKKSLAEKKKNAPERPQVFEFNGMRIGGHISEALIGNTYVDTIDGQLVTVEVSVEAILTLHEIIHAVHHAFANAPEAEQP